MKECKWPEYWDEACNADKTPIAEYKVKLRLAYALYYEYSRHKTAKYIF